MKITLNLEFIHISDAYFSVSLGMKEIHIFSLKFLRVKILKISKFYALVSPSIKGLQRTSTMFGDLRDRPPTTRNAEEPKKAAVEAAL